MSETDDSAFDDRIRQNVSDAVPPAVERRLRARLASFRSVPAAREAFETSHRRWTRPARWGFGVASAAAAAVLAVGVLLTFGPRAGFAQVRDAVLERPWIHVRTSHGGLVDDEQWISAGKGIWASRRPGSIEYRDERLRLCDSFDPAEGVVYHTPAFGRSRGDEMESLVKAMKVLLQGDRVPERPPLGFLGPGSDTLRVLDQSVERVREPGQDRLDYSLTVKDDELTDPIRLLFRVDASTKLPLSCRIEGRHNGQPFAVEMRFDYPENGPADIYALGVPETARMVDRVPSDDIQRILDTLQAGRERMDPYRAVFVEDGIYYWWAATPIVLYRKGTRYRDDYRSPIRGGAPHGFGRPPEGVDQRQWWFERAKADPFVTQYVQRDSIQYSSDRKTVTDPDGSQHLEIASVSRVNFGGKPEDVFPINWASRPEFACRPPLGLPSAHFEPVLDLHPTDGPPGCVLLGVRHTSTKGRIDEKGVGIPDGYRYWLDPKRDYIVVRWAMVQRDATGKEVVTLDNIVEETARSPQGVWYATKIRHKDCNPSRAAKPIDWIRHIYVDFDVALPDSLFEPQKPGRVN
jgi:hypothetical protein